MAVTLTDHRTAPNEADAITNWVGSPTLFTTDPDPVEATGCIGYVVSTATVDAYATVAAQSLADGLVYVWAFPRGAMDTRANGGIQIHLGDGTNRIGFHLGGSDVSPFRHDVGPVGWQCMVMDTTNIPAQRTVRAGSLANLNYGALTQIGAIFKTLAKSVGGAQNCFVDVIRVINASTLSANDGCVMTVAGGTSGDPGTFLNIATLDRSTGNLQGYGLLRELGAGLYGLQGPLRFGNATGTASSWFEETNVALAFESRGLATSRYRLFVADNGTGTTTVKFGEKTGTGTEASGANGVSVTSPAGVGGEWDSATDTDVTDVFVYGSTFTGLTNGVKFRSPQEWAGNTFAGCGQIQPNGAYMVNCAVVGSTASSALLWDVAQDTQGRLDGTSFVSGGTGHAIELGSSVPSELTFSGLTFGGYGADGTTNAAVYNNSGKALTIYVSGGTPTVRNGTGASTTFVANPVTLTLTGVQDGSEVRIYKAGTRADELYGIETKLAGVDPSFTYTTPEPVDIIVHSLGFQYWRLENYALGTTNASLPISQIVDRNYRNPP